MNLNEYQKTAKNTAIFPKNNSLAYVALGLNGEAGEVAEHIKKILRGDKIPFEERKDLIKKELGDVLWYLAMTADVLGLTLEEVAYTNIQKLYSRQQRGCLQGSGDNR
jgi:NTP pyrophosphatase (non-canonical NTP hydrolase)